LDVSSTAAEAVSTGAETTSSVGTWEVVSCAKRTDDNPTDIIPEIAKIANNFFIVRSNF
jgi:hypothetical protein